MSNLHPWQSDVREFHLGMNLATGDYSNPMGLGGDTLQLRIRLLDEELIELLDAWEREDLTEIVDALIDVAYITLGTFDVCGIVCRPRFGLLTSTGVYRGFDGFKETVALALRAVSRLGTQALSVMVQHRSQDSAFERWDMLEALMQEIAHCFCALGIDPRPMWDAVHSNNLEKAGGPIVNGKLTKPPGFKPVDLRPLLKAQGVVG
jgi:predicted HAD superfamily Cof-like phosphohydrolase